jgi:thymidylate synthase (FAD)
MKLIKQSFEILEQKDFSLIGIKKFIERCGRVCYKSEDKITDDSYEKFVNMLDKRDHARPLEFGTVHLRIDSEMLFKKFLQDLVDCKLYNPTWIKYKKLPEYTYITTNYRHYLQIIKKCPYIAEYFTEQDNCYYPSRYTVHMVLSRGIMDEFRTHVSLSHLAESTRYCNYYKDKFDNELTFIIPNWVDTIEEGTYTKDHKFPPMWGHDSWMDSEWFYAMCGAEETYLIMVQEYLSPQQARDVLPLSVKSELISCGFEDAWSNFFYRRCANDAHPMAREIAIPLQEKFKELGYVNQ